MNHSDRTGDQAPGSLPGSDPAERPGDGSQEPGLELEGPLEEPAAGGLSPLEITLVVLVAAIGCFVLAYFQPFGVSRDYPDYEAFFDEVRSGEAALTAGRFEPGFLMISRAAALIAPSSIFAYALLAAVGCGVKFGVIASYAERPYVLLPVAAFYVARFMPLHELTQLRASLAIAALFVAFKLVDGNRPWRALWAMGAAALLHLSAWLAAPFMFVRIRYGRRALVMAGVTVLALGLVFEVLFSVLAPSVQALAMYDLAQSLGESFESANAFGPAFLLDMAAVGALTLCWQSTTTSMRRVLVFQAAAIAIVFALAGWPVFANRFRELFAVLWTILLVQGVRGTRSVRVVSYALILLSVLGYGRMHFFSETEPLFR